MVNIAVRRWTVLARIYCRLTGLLRSFPPGYTLLDRLLLLLNTGQDPRPDGSVFCRLRGQLQVSLPAVFESLSKHAESLPLLSRQRQPLSSVMQMLVLIRRYCLVFLESINTFKYTVVVYCCRGWYCCQFSNWSPWVYSFQSQGQAAYPSVLDDDVTRSCDEPPGYNVPVRK